MYGKVGRQTISDGVSAQPRLEETGALVVQSFGGNLQEAAMAGRLFTAAMQTPTTSSTTLNTNFVGLALVNPTGSGKVIIVHRFSYGTTAQANACVLALATTTDSGFAADITPRCCRYGYAASIAIVDKAANPIAAPVIERIVATIGNGAVTTAQLYAPTFVDLQGSIILEPGRAVVTDTTAATGAVAQFGSVWEEVEQ